MYTLKDVGRFCLGCVFLISCIPPALIVLAFYLIHGGARDGIPD